jgi:2-polyprenyl-6-methoxyphenol hydroxylase-like FAD-dependent oxidoreductase
MLLAQRGLDVLVVDRTARGSDTLSTHALMRGGVNQLHRWGLLPRVVDAGTPAIRRTSFRYGDDTLTIDITGDPGQDALYAPRRTVLDPIIADAAVDAGAELLYETRLDTIRTDSRGRVDAVEITRPDGTRSLVHTDLLIGADGLQSTVARRLQVPITRQGRASSASIYKYLAGADLPRNENMWLYQPGLAAGVVPTNDGQHCVFVTMPPGRFRAEARGAIEPTFDRLLSRIAPDVAAATEGRSQDGATRSFPGRPGQFRRPFGPGWALVGDAGYFKDPGAAHGISDALRDAELLADAVVDSDFGRYEELRNSLSAPLFELLEELAALDWDFDRLKQIHIGMSKAINHELAALTELRTGALAA